MIKTMNIHRKCICIMMKVVSSIFLSTTMLVLDTQQQQTYRKETRSRSISQVHLSSDKDIDIVTFKRALVSFTFKTVYQIMTESLEFSPIWTSLDNPESTPPVYVSANWQTAKQLIVIIPPNSSKLPGVWSIANIISNGLSYGSTLLLLEQCLEDGDGVIILQPEGQYDVLETKHVKEGESTSTNKLAADVERILNNVANNNEGLSLEKFFMIYQTCTLRKLFKSKHVLFVGRFIKTACMLTMTYVLGETKLHGMF